MSQKWLKYRHVWASGPSKEWDFLELGTIPAHIHEEALNDTLWELKQEYQHEDHYRGIEHEIVDKPDSVWIKKELSQVISRISVLETYKTRLEKLREA